MNKPTIQSFETIDQAIAKRMNKWGIPLVKFSFAIIFIWFGILKPLGWSAAIPIIRSTVSWLPFFESKTWVHLAV